MMIWAMLLVAPTAGGAQLDAPVPQQPTVRSEIKNGYDAGEACSNLRLPADKLDDCLARIVTSYRVAHASADAFLVGINVRKWILGARFAGLAADLPGNRLAQDYAIYGKVSAGQAEMDLETATARLKITVGDAFDAAGVAPASRPRSVLTR